MIIVTLVGGGRREYAGAARFLTEDVFNNLCLHNAKDELIAVFAQDQWLSVEVSSGDKQKGRNN